MNAPAQPLAGSSMIRRLVFKDWYFMRWPIACYLALGGFALVLVANGGEGSFYAGSVLLFTILFSLGIHLAMATVVEERTQQTLPFVMSLPISPADYTLAKVVANLTIFVIPWGLLVLGTLAVIAGRAAIEDGLIPFAAIVLTWILVGYCLILAVALVSESQAWAIAAIVVSNLGFQAVLYGVSHVPSIAATMKHDIAVWSPAAVGLLAAEFAAVVLLLALTFFFQNRKTDFI
jgi:ABC-type transport system involved in multi-copper enzyme maturation permease subunit